MVKFIAKQAVDSAQLPGVSMLFEPEEAYFYDRNGDYFRVAPDALKEGMLLEVRGHGFDYLFSVPTGSGTVTQLNVRTDKDPFYKITGLNVKLDSLLDSDAEHATNLMFKGNDTFKGSPGIDFLHGREGKDEILGKDGNDTLFGEAGNDTLDGGKGSDTLNGGPRLDTYVFKTADAVDSIVNFKAGEMIELTSKAFPGLVKGKLPEDQFYVTGKGVQDDNDYIVYTRGEGDARGAIYYDPDGGANSAARITITTLQPEFGKLGADNFLVI